MLITFFSWIWIGTCSFLLGFGFLQNVFPRKHTLYWSPDTYIMMGLCILTVYAQVFSLFYKVSGLAVAFLAVICAVIAIFSRKKLINFGKFLISSVKSLKIIFVLILAGGMILILTAQTPTHYDTGLYHAQSIRWIEEFGVVKGLGNLHFRFAYNSSFFALQALFSLKFLLGQSMHSMNGFIVLIMCIYAVANLKIQKSSPFFTSDLLKLGLLWYVGLSMLSVSSPHSDFLALSLILYVSAKWSELIEESCEDVADYGVLCLLAVWALTVKLSAATLVVLAFWPAVRLISAKNWKTIGALLISGIIIIAPFLARNVVISGYLVYPYEKLDLFDVDWKIPADRVEADRVEIEAWGRGLGSAHRSYFEPASVWLPIWYSQLSIKWKAAVWLDLACLVWVTGYAVWCVKAGVEWKTHGFISKQYCGISGLVFDSAFNQVWDFLYNNIPRFVYRSNIGESSFWESKICCVICRSSNLPDVLYKKYRKRSGMAVP